MACLLDPSFFTGESRWQKSGKITLGRDRTVVGREEGKALGAAVDDRVGAMLKVVWIG
jgi:hypothetical protein